MPDAAKGLVHWHCNPCLDSYLMPKSWLCLDQRFCSTITSLASRIRDAQTHPLTLDVQQIGSDIFQWCMRVRNEGINIIDIRVIFVLWRPCDISNSDWVPLPPQDLAYQSAILWRGVLINAVDHLNSRRWPSAG